MSTIFNSFSSITQLNLDSIHQKFKAKLLLEETLNTRLSTAIKHQCCLFMAIPENSCWLQLYTETPNTEEEKAYKFSDIITEVCLLKSVLIDVFVPRDVFASTYKKLKRQLLDSEGTNSGFYAYHQCKSCTKRTCWYHWSRVTWELGWGGIMGYQTISLS